MAVCLEYWLWDSFVHPQLKQIFGNRKNFYRYIEAKKWNQWNQWLFSLGYRKDYE